MYILTLSLIYSIFIVLLSLYNL